MPAKIHQFPCLSDNFGVLIHDPETGATAAIDAPETAAVDQALKDTGWTLTDILVTHHHADHTDGIPALKQHHGCRVVAPEAEAKRIPLVDETVREGDKVRVMVFARDRVKQDTQIATRLLDIGATWIVEESANAGAAPVTVMVRGPAPR